MYSQSNDLFRSTSTPEEAIAVSTEGAVIAAVYFIGHPTGVHASIE